MLHARTGNADHIHFLKCIRTDGGRTDLSRNHHQRNGIAVCSGNTRNRIGCAGARSNQRNAHFPAGTGIGIGSVDGSLLVPRQDMSELFKLEYGIVNFQNCATRIAENIFHALGSQAVYNDLRS